MAVTTTSESVLGDLLAVIHRDGGHHTAKVGLLQSALDATAVHIALVQDNEEYEHTFELIQKAERRAIEQWREERGPRVLGERQVVIPDAANLLTWLLNQLEAADLEIVKLQGLLRRHL